MKKISLVARLERFFSARPGQWIPKGEVARLAESSGYLGETCGRRLRECESGIGSDGKPCKKFLEERKNEKGHVEYRYLPSDKIISRFVEVDGVIKECKQKVMA